MDQKCWKCLRILLHFSFYGASDRVQTHDLDYLNTIACTDGSNNGEKVSEFCYIFYSPVLAIGFKPMTLRLFEHHRLHRWIKNGEKVLDFCYIFHSPVLAIGFKPTTLRLFEHHRWHRWIKNAENVLRILLHFSFSGTSDRVQTHDLKIMSCILPLLCCHWIV